MSATKEQISANIAKQFVSNNSASEFGGSPLQSTEGVNNMNPILSKRELVNQNIVNQFEKGLKGGEGSRGGKITGHTSTGKPIYEGSEKTAKKMSIPEYRKHLAARAKKSGDKDLHKYSQTASTEALKRQKFEDDHEDMFEKGAISDSLGYGYGSGNEAIKFTKTGKELKAQMPTVIANLKSQMASMSAKMDVIREKLGVDPTEPHYRNKNVLCYPSKDCYPAYDNISNKYAEPTESNKLCSAYSELCSAYISILEDVNTCSVIMGNVVDNQKYTLTVSQLVALSWGVADTMSKGIESTALTANRQEEIRRNIVKGFQSEEVGVAVQPSYESNLFQNLIKGINSVDQLIDYQNIGLIEVYTEGGLKSYQDALIKSHDVNALSKAVRERSHLVRKEIVNKSGHKQVVYVKPGQNAGSKEISANGIIQSKKQLDAEDIKKITPHYDKLSYINKIKFKKEHKRIHGKDYDEQGVNSSKADSNKPSEEEQEIIDRYNQLNTADYAGEGIEHEDAVRSMKETHGHSKKKIESVLQKHNVKKINPDDWKKKEEEEPEFSIGDTVRIPSNLTSYPAGRKGESGKVKNIDAKSGDVTVQFPDGGTAVFTDGVVKKVEPKKEDKVVAKLKEDDGGAKFKNWETADLKDYKETLEEYLENAKSTEMAKHRKRNLEQVNKELESREDKDVRHNQTKKYDEERTERAKNADYGAESRSISYLKKLLGKDDAEITIKKNKSGDRIAYVNGQTAFNLDNVYNNGQGSEDRGNALLRAYNASKSDKKKDDTKKPAVDRDKVIREIGESMKMPNDEWFKSKSKEMGMTVEKLKEAVQTSIDSHTEERMEKIIPHLNKYLTADQAELFVNYYGDRIRRMTGSYSIQSKIADFKEKIKNAGGIENFKKKMNSGN